MRNSPLLIGLATFIITLALTQFLTYQQRVIAITREREELTFELHAVHDRFRTLLNHNTAIAYAVGSIYENYGAPRDFNTLAAHLIENNKFVDGIQLSRGGVMTHVYPYEENKVVIGFDLFKDPLRKKEALQTIALKEIHYAGPYDLMQGGGKAIIGRLPVFRNNRFLGFSVVLTKLSTINRYINTQDQGRNKFIYQLSKTHPIHQRTEYFYYDSVFMGQREWVSTFMKEGDWTIYVAHNDLYQSHISGYKIIGILGLILSITFGGFAYQRARRPEILKSIIAEKSKQLANDEQYYRTIIETSSDAIVLLSEKGEVTYQTPSTQRISGYSLPDFQKRDGLELIHPDDRDLAKKRYGEALQSPGKPIHLKHRLLHKKGYYIWLEGTYRNLLNDENVGRLVMTYTDVTQRILFEQRLSKINREITLLNTVNDSIYRLENETALLNEICKCAVTSGGYKLAWISDYPDPLDKQQLIKPIEAFGETNYLKKVVISTNDPVLSKGPTAQVLLHGKPVITNNVYHSENFKPWLENARQFGIAASIVLPLKFIADQVTGTLNIYSESIDAFDANEVETLERLANNLSLAIRNIRNRKEKEEAQFMLKERIKELTAIYLVNKIIHDDKLTIDEMLQQVTDILPLGWQFNDVCQARIHYGKKVFETTNYKLPVALQRANFKTGDQVEGMLEVSYSELRPAFDEGPFLKEERDLINNLAEMIEDSFNKRFNQEALLKSEANLKSVFENTEIGYALLNRNFDVMAFNKRMEQGYALETGIKLELQRNFLELLIPERMENTRKLFDEILSTQKPLEYETHFTNNNTTHYYNITLVPVINNGESIGICLSAYDITNAKNLELERKKIIQDIIQRNRDLEQFAYIVAHNVRAPLATILGLSSLLNMDLVEEDKITTIDGIVDSAQRLDLVLDDLNQILRTRRELKELRVNVSLSAVLREVVSSIQFTLNQTGAKIESDFTAIDHLFTVRSYLHSIFLNLITNSIKYARPEIPAIIKIRSEKLEKQIRIYFTDNGIGINLNKYKDHLFGLYKRFNTSVEGKGLGLYMVKTQIEVLNGSIDVQSEVGQGTTFIITLNYEPNPEGEERLDQAIPTK